MIENIGILHPGAMGVSVAASVQLTGYSVYWASEGRSEQSSQRAEEHRLTDVRSIGKLCQICSTILCVCPPHAAEDVAGEVIEHSFKGLYADLNAISPGRAVRIGHRMAASGIAFVDGGIIGGPAWEPDLTWLYLAGPDAEKVVGYFSGGPLGTEIIGNQIGQASALKMCYAAYSKGSTALLCALLAAADTLGVRHLLEEEWDRSDPSFSNQTYERVRRVTAKAWRFSGEMEEIADTFESVGIPDGFHRASAEIYRRMAGYKDAETTPSVEDVLSKLVFIEN